MEVDENTSLQDEAARDFVSIQKQSTHERRLLADSRTQIANSRSQTNAELERIIRERDTPALENFDKSPSPARTSGKTQRTGQSKTVPAYVVIFQRTVMRFSSGEQRAITTR